VCGRDEEVLREDIQRIINAGLAWESETKPGTFMFKHALIRDAAYESLLRSTRQEYHRRIAAALTKPPLSATSGNGLIADQLTHAGEYSDAVRFWEAAGNEALDRIALPEAAYNFRRAVECLGTLPGTPDIMAHELELQQRLAHVLMAVYGWASPEVEQACERARQLAQSLHRDDGLYRALWGLWSVYFLRGELGQAWSAAQTVHRMAEEFNDSLRRVTGRHVMAYTLVFRGELEAALAEADEGLALFDIEQEKSIAKDYLISSTVCLRQSRAQALWMLGHVEEADAEAERMLQLARDLKHPPSLAAALAFYLHGGGIRYSYTGEMARLQEIADELCILARDDGFYLWQAVAETYLGIIAHARGEKDSRKHMLEWRELFLQTRTRVTLVMMNVMIAEALYDLGDDDQAFHLLDEAELELRTRDEGLDAPEIWRVRGRLLARRGARAEAEAAFRESLVFAGRQKARSLELRAALDLHDFLSSIGRGDDGRTLLAAITDRSALPLDRPEPRRAMAILRGIPSPPFR
jgi:tetratricopeptide (TPR) repeat protein